MPDHIDLNALKAIVPEQPEETTEQKIERLNREIAELEAKVAGPNKYEQFMALASGEKAERLRRVNAEMPADQHYSSVEKYAEELKPKPGAPDVNKMRLQMKKNELKKILER